MECHKPDPSVQSFILLQVTDSFKKPWDCGDLELVPIDTRVTAEALLRHPRGVTGLSRMVGVDSRDLVPLLEDPVDWETGMAGLSFFTPEGLKLTLLVR